MLTVSSRRAAARARASLHILAALPGIGSASPATPPAAPAPELMAPVFFQNYQAWRDEPLLDWRAVNDRVSEVGGWRTYLRESQPAAGGAGPDPQGLHGHPDR